MLLNVNGIDVFYGKVQALFDVSFQVEENEIVSIIGANGAGKTTLMKTIMGINKPRKGSIEYNGRLISGQPVHKVVQNEIVYVPEGREIFMGMTVRENLLLRRLCAQPESLTTSCSKPTVPACLLSLSTAMAKHRIPPVSLTIL